MSVFRLAGLFVVCLASVAANAATVVQNGNFSFNHSSAVSSGAISIAGTYTQTDTASPSALSFNQFNAALGRLDQVTVAVATTTSTFTVQPSGVLALVSTGSATRTLAYQVTAGATTGGDNAQAVTSGVALVNLLGLGTAQIGGASLNKSTVFTIATDLANFTGAGTVSLGITATDTLSVTTVLSLFNGAGFSGTGTYAGSVTVTYTYTPWSILSGTVYNDTNHSGFRDAAETGTGLTLYVKVLNESSPAGPALQAVAVNSASGAFSFQVARGGTYRILVDDNTTLSDVTPLVTPSGWSATQAATFLRSGLLVSADTSGQDFGLVHATTLCGRSFNDNGAAAGTANDGIRNGGESGLGSHTMQLLDAGNAVLDSASSASDGSYCLYIPSTAANGAALRAVRVLGPLYLATGASVGNSAGTYLRSADSVSFSNGLNQNYTGLNFGAVGVPVLSGEGDQGGTPSAVLWFAHRFTASSAGQVALSASHVASPDIATLSYAIYRDANDDGRIDAGDPAVTGPIVVSAGTVIPLLVKVTIPAAAPSGAHAQINLRADVSFTGAAPPLLYTLVSPDQLTVLAPSSASLQLVKSVDRATAAPGATLVYTLTFVNAGPSPIQQLVINDMTPAHTSFTSSAALSLPAALGTMSITAPAAGARGLLRWNFSGQLQPGASGSIQFSVVVDP